MTSRTGFRTGGLPEVDTHEYEASDRTRIRVFFFFFLLRCMRILLMHKAYQNYQLAFSRNLALVRKSYSRNSTENALSRSSMTIIIQSHIMASSKTTRSLRHAVRYYLTGNSYSQFGILGAHIEDSFPWRWRISEINHARRSQHDPTYTTTSTTSHI